MYLIRGSTKLISDVQGIENDVLNVNHNNDLVDLLFPIIDTADFASIYVILVLFLWFVIGFGIEFTHRYRRWHRIVDVSIIIIIVVVSWILYQQYAMGQLSVNTILQMVPYLLTLFFGAFAGYVTNRLTTNHESEIS
jgi:ABC-type Na+ efflux pump permease subunit